MAEHSTILSESRLTEIRVSAAWQEAGEVEDGHDAELLASHDALIDLLRRTAEALDSAAQFVQEFDQGDCEIDRGYCYRHHEVVPDGSPVCEDGRTPDDLLPTLQGLLAELRAEGVLK